MIFRLSIQACKQVPLSIQGCKQLPSFLRPVRVISSSRNASDSLSSCETVRLAYDDFSANVTSSQPPLVMCHGMLGSRQNFASIAKALHRDTGRRVISVDARNHGDSPHSSSMTYHHMAADIGQLVADLGLDRVSLLGHSMGGRAVMLLALLKPELLDRLVVVDISPVNADFESDLDTTFDMDYFFHCLKGVNIRQDLTLSEARKDADAQLSLRIKDAPRRAWLLMNLVEDDELGTNCWRVNLDAIHSAFRSNISRFPHVEDAIFMKPTLFIGGALSDYIQVTDHDEIKEMFPTAEITYIPNCNHWVHAENPTKFISLCNKFLSD